MPAKRDRRGRSFDGRFGFLCDVVLNQTSCAKQTGRIEQTQTTGNMASIKLLVVEAHRRITQLKAQGSSRTCNDSQEQEAEEEIQPQSSLFRSRKP